jgi:hypothetical protein
MIAKASPVLPSVFLCYVYACNSFAISPTAHNAIILLVTSALFWLATTTTTVKADKVQISQWNHEEPGRTLVYVTQEKSGRTLKKAPKIKKSKSPVKKKPKSKAPSKKPSKKPTKKPVTKAPSTKPSKRPSGCSSNCYSNSNSPAFVTKLTSASNYHENVPLVLNICSGEKISIPTGTSTENNYYIALPNNNSTSGSCTKYQLIINCCGGLSNCILDYAGLFITSGLVGIFDYNPSDSGVTLAVTLNGITLTSSTPDVQIFF